MDATAKPVCLPYGTRKAEVWKLAGVHCNVKQNWKGVQTHSSMHFPATAHTDLNNRSKHDWSR